MRWLPLLALLGCAGPAEDDGADDPAETDDAPDTDGAPDTDDGPDADPPDTDADTDVGPSDDGCEGLRLDGDALVLDQAGEVTLCPGAHRGTVRLSSDGVVILGRGATLDAGGEVAVVVDDGVTGARIEGLTVVGSSTTEAAVVLGAGAGLDARDVHVQGQGTGAGGYDVGAGGALALLDGSVSGHVAAEGAGVRLAAGATLNADGTELSELSAVLGGAVYVGDGATAVLRDVTARDTAATDRGGFLAAVDAASVELDLVRVDGSSADAGGAVDVVGGGAVVLDNLRVTSAEATTGDGGAVRLDGAGAVEVYRVVLVDVEAAGDGGGLWLSGTQVVNVLHLTVERGRATRGGGLFAVGGAGVWTDLQVRDSEAVDGAGLYLDEPRSTLVLPALVRNVATGRGGGLFVDGGDSRALEATIEDNEAADGGCAHVQGLATYVLSGGTYAGNAAARGGCLSLGPGWLTLEYGVWRDNTATAEGGFAFVDTDGRLGLDFCVVEDNRAPRGGALAMGGVGGTTTTTFLEAVVRSNDATGGDGGGAAWIGNGQLSIEGSDLGAGASDNTPDDVSTPEGASSWTDLVNATCRTTGCEDPSPP